jgi:N6-L-threonylcarbamoyladenine synthase
MTRILGLESSCDETAAAIIEVNDAGELHILSSIVASQVETHRLYGGVVPEIAGRAHSEAISNITYEALEKAAVTPRELSAVAVTTHPGLIGALLVAVNFAKSFAAVNGLPLVGVDHMKGHIASAYLLSDAPKPPFLALAVSGGHTSIFEVKDYTEYRRIGETRDDAIGEAFDKIGRIIGIPYPAGAGFDALATEGFRRASGKDEGFYEAYRGSDAYRDPLYRLPSPALSDGSLDFSFSGLKTAAINLLHRAEQTSTPIDQAIFAAAYTYEAVEAVAKKLSLAFERYPSLPLVVSGGVAANSHLRRRLAALCEKANRRLYIPPISLCGDNGAMIAAQGYYEWLSGERADSSLNAFAADDI